MHLIVSSSFDLGIDYSQFGYKNQDKLRDSVSWYIALRRCFLDFISCIRGNQKRSFDKTMIFFLCLVLRCQIHTVLSVRSVPLFSENRFPMTIFVFGSSYRSWCNIVTVDVPHTVGQPKWNQNRKETNRFRNAIRFAIVAFVFVRLRVSEFSTFCCRFRKRSVREKRWKR